MIAYRKRVSLMECLVLRSVLCYLKGKGYTYVISNKSSTTLEFIGGPGVAPRKVSPQAAIKWLFCTQCGYFMGTNDVYMGINVHICIQNEPAQLTGGFRGAKPPKLPF